MSVWRDAAGGSGTKSIKNIKTGGIITLAHKIIDNNYTQHTNRISIELIGGERSRIRIARITPALYVQTVFYNY